MRSTGAKKFNREKSTVSRGVYLVVTSSVKLTGLDFWYNKWAGGDKEDALAK